MSRTPMVAASLGVLLLSVSLLNVSLLTAASATDLTVTIGGVRDAKGSIAVGVFNTAATFARPGQAMATFRAKAAPGEMSFTLHSLPPGKYGVVSFHDENNNGALDVDPTGAPTEGYGVSNDARRGDGPPQFGEAAFEVAGERTRISVKLFY